MDIPWKRMISLGMPHIHSFKNANKTNKNAGQARMADKRMQCQTQVRTHTHTHRQGHHNGSILSVRRKQSWMNPLPQVRSHGPSDVSVYYKHTYISHHYTIFNRKTTFLKLTMNPKLLLFMSLHTHSVLTAVYTVKSLMHTLKVIKSPYTLPI